MLRNFTGESTADAAATHAISIPTGTNLVTFQSLTISTRGADIAADVKVAITVNAREVWIAWLRSGQIHGGHFANIGDIAVDGKALGITTVAGGASCIVVTSAVVKANDQEQG